MSASATPAPTPNAAPVIPQTPFQVAWARAKRDALRGGVPGMIAMALQVLTLMWMRTAVNYQYRHGGTSMRHALTTLYAQGGIRRLYSGLGFALMQAPLSRFGDTAANAGVLSLLENLESTKGLPVAFKTFGASFAAGCFRIFLMPIDALKTSMQVDGKQGLSILMTKCKQQGFLSLYRGSIAASTATFVGHYPWFATYNYLDAHLPKARDTKERLVRSAAMGFVSSAISDTCSNSIRVVKTVRQTSAEKLSYMQVVQKVLAEEGMKGLFGRGLSTKIVSNGIQGTMFSVFWRLGQDAWEKKYGKH